MPNYDAMMLQIVFWMRQSFIVKKMPFKNLSIIKLANDNIPIS